MAFSRPCSTCVITLALTGAAIDSAVASAITVGKLIASPFRGSWPHEHEIGVRIAVLRDKDQFGADVVYGPLFEIFRNDEPQHLAGQSIRIVSSRNRLRDCR